MSQLGNRPLRTLADAGGTKVLVNGVAISGGLVRISTDAPRVVRIPDGLTDDLTGHLREYVREEPTAYVFAGEKGGTLRRHVWQKIWDQARRTVGMEHLHFHDLRHTGNTLAATSGASTKELMARLGHSSPQAALRYQHATPERDAAIAEFLDGVIQRARCAMDAPSQGQER